MQHTYGMMLPQPHAHPGSQQHPQHHHQHPQHLQHAQHHHQLRHGQLQSVAGQHGMHLSHPAVGHPGFPSAAHMAQTAHIVATSVAPARVHSIIQPHAVVPSTAMAHIRAVPGTHTAMVGTGDARHASVMLAVGSHSQPPTPSTSHSRRTTPLSDATRTKIIEMWKAANEPTNRSEPGRGGRRQTRRRQEGSVRHIAQTLGVGKSTVARLLEAYKDTNGTGPLPESNYRRRRRLSDSDMAALRTWLATSGDKTPSYSAIKAKCSELYKASNPDKEPWVPSNGYIYTLCRSVQVVFRNRASGGSAPSDRMLPLSEGSPAVAVGRTSRKRFSPAARERMEAWYAENRRPDKKTLVWQAQELGDTFDRVRQWFHNRRYKDEAKDKAEKDASDASRESFTPQQLQALQQWRSSKSGGGMDEVQRVAQHINASVEAVAAWVRGQRRGLKRGREDDLLNDDGSSAAGLEGKASSSGKAKTKIQRRRFSPQQRAQLEAWFEQEHTPDHDEIQRQSKLLSEAYQRVYMWYHNQRAKKRRQGVVLRRAPAQGRGRATRPAGVPGAVGGQHLDVSVHAAPHVQKQQQQQAGAAAVAVQHTATPHSHGHLTHGHDSTGSSVLATVVGTAHSQPQHLGGSTVVTAAHMPHVASATVVSVGSPEGQQRRVQGQQHEEEEEEPESTFLKMSSTSDLMMDMSDHTFQDLHMGSDSQVLGAGSGQASPGAASGDVPLSVVSSALARQRRFTKEQVEKLELYFSKGPTPTGKQVAVISGELGVQDHKRIVMWFRNRRVKQAKLDERAREAAQRERAGSGGTREAGTGGSMIQRKRFKPKQRAQLEQWCSVNPNPSKADREKMAAVLGENFERVSVWFRNKRAKLRSDVELGAGEGEAAAAVATPGVVTAVEYSNPTAAAAAAAAAAANAGSHMEPSLVEISSISMADMQYPQHDVTQAGGAYTASPGGVTMVAVGSSLPGEELAPLRPGASLTGMQHHINSQGQQQPTLRSAIA